MTDLSDIIHILPSMKSGDDLFSALEVLPKYDDTIRTADVPLRLMALSDLYRIYVPSQMSLEIYSKMYLALLRSLQKKGTKMAVQQKNQNHKAVIQQEYSGIMGGSDSFTIIGASGIGKSSAISRAIEILNLESLNEAYQKRLSLLHGFIHPEQKKQTSKRKRKVSAVDINISGEEKNSGEFTIAGLVSVAKDEDIDIVQLLKGYMPVVEVAV